MVLTLFLLGVLYVVFVGVLFAAGAQAGPPERPPASAAVAVTTPPAMTYVEPHRTLRAKGPRRR